MSTEPTPPETPGSSGRFALKPTALALLRRWIIAGLLIWIPLSITLLVIRFVFGVLDTSLLLLPVSLRPSIPGLGVLLSIGLVIGTGALTANLIGVAVIKWVEAAVARVPLLGTVYGGIKKLAETIFSGSGKSFRQAVLVQWPRAGVWTIGFITAFVPTTPNPTSGFIVVVARAELKLLDMSVEQAMRMVISLGVVVPDRS